MKKKTPTKRKADDEIVRKTKENITVSDFYRYIRYLIEEARLSVALTVNAGMTMLYRQIGKRAEYGKEIVISLARQLVLEHGNNFSHFKEIINIECAEGSHEQIELLELHRSSIKIAEYLTELPPKELLEKKFHAAIEKSRALLEQRGKDD